MGRGRGGGFPHPPGGGRGGHWLHIVDTLVIIRPFLMQGAGTWAEGMVDMQPMNYMGKEDVERMQVCVTLIRMLSNYTYIIIISLQVTILVMVQ